MLYTGNSSSFAAASANSPLTQRYLPHKNISVSQPAKLRPIAYKPPRTKSRSVNLIPSPPRDGGTKRRSPEGVTSLWISTYCPRHTRLPYLKMASTTDIPSRTATHQQQHQQHKEEKDVYVPKVDLYTHIGRKVEQTLESTSTRTPANWSVPIQHSAMVEPCVAKSRFEASHPKRREIRVNKFRHSMHEKAGPRRDLSEWFEDYRVKWRAPHHFDTTSYSRRFF